MMTLAAGAARCVVTSPPYWGLRDYGHADQLGLEPTPEAYVANLVDVFREVWRVLADDGTLWLNLGDSYITNRGQASRGGPPSSSSTLDGNGHRGGGPKLKAMRRVNGRPETNGRGDRQLVGSVDPKNGIVRAGERPNRQAVVPGLKNKDLACIPWRVAMALQADGWWLRSDIIWAKPSPMPESTTDRPTKAHEYVFLLSKSEHYFYDAKAIAERAVSTAPAGNKNRKKRLDAGGVDENRHQAYAVPWADVGGTRNARTVWTIPPAPYGEAHFATMPPKLAERCILAGSAIGDTVLDPFMGSGTVAMVAEANGRHWLGCELNPDYAELITKRTSQRGLLAGAP